MVETNSIPVETEEVVLNGYLLKLNGKIEQTIDLKGKQFNLEYLKRLTDLKKIYIDGTSVTGDISVLQNLRQLEEIIILNSMNIFGDINNLQSLTNLKKIYLDRTNVTGDIDVLQNLKNLEEISFFNMEIKGNINSLQSLTKLKQVGLGYTEITGNISDLSSLQELKQIDIRRTQVTGNIPNSSATIYRDPEISSPNISPEAYQHVANEEWRRKRDGWNKFSPSRWLEKNREQLNRIQEE